METIQSVIKGGEWMIKEVNAKDIFIPEEFNEEQLMVRDMCNQFIDTEVLPVVERIDKLEPGLMPSLLEKAGAQGLLGITIPEAYGGSGKDFVTSVIVAEYLGGGYSFQSPMQHMLVLAPYLFYILVQRCKNKSMLQN